VEEEPLVAVCAWCQRTVTAARAGARVTHTMCEACQERMFASTSGIERRPARSGQTASPESPDDVLEP
jgi:hypothetical protein